ncbi:hypothetical protein ACHXY8_12680 [Neobacillus thermocopriae]|nr:hypothetical protein [Neobacillus thermocopriae]
MFPHMIPLLQLFLTMRLEKDFSAIVKKIPYIKRISLILIIKNLIFTFLSIVAVYFFYHKYLFYMVEYRDIIVLFILLLLLFISLLNGVLAYKRTHFPIYGDLLSLSPLNNKEIFFLLIAEEMIWLIFQNVGFLLSILIFLYWLMSISIFSFLLFSIVIILSMAFMFTLGNICWGRYQIYKIQKKIGFIRFMIYLLNACLFMSFGFLISHTLAFIIKTFRAHFHYFDQLMNDQFYESLLGIFKNEFILFIFQLINKIYQFSIYTFITSFIKSENVFSYILGIVIIIFLLYLLKYFTPIYGDNQFIKKSLFHHDYLYIYTKIVNKVFNRNHNAIFHKELIILNKSRWIISPGVFSIIFYTFESFFYLGVLLGIGVNMTNDPMFIALLLLFNAMIMIMHCYDIVSEFPQIFFLSSEGKNIEFIRSSPIGIQQLFEAKIRLLHAVLTIPMVISFSFSCFLLLYTKNFNLLTIILLISILLIMYFISPMIQLYMAPYYAKFNFDDIQEVGSTYEEKELHIRSQSVPRYIILIPALIFSFLNIFFPFYQYIPFIHIIYFVAIFLPALIYLIVSKKIINKGLYKLERRIF